MASKLIPLSGPVRAACAADRSVQVQLVAAMAADMFTRFEAGEDLAGYPAMVFAEFPHRELKTWANYATPARKLSEGVGHLSLVNLVQVSATEEEAVSRFAVWLETELKKGGYGVSVDDIANYANGRLSRSAREKAIQRAEREQAKAAPAPAPAAAPAAAVAPAPAAAPAAAVAPAPAPAPEYLLFFDGETLVIEDALTARQCEDIITALLEHMKAAAMARA